MTIYIQGFLLQETGDYLLQEDGDQIILDQLVSDAEDYIPEIIGTAVPPLFGFARIPQSTLTFSANGQGLTRKPKPSGVARVTDKGNIV